MSYSICLKCDKMVSAYQKYCDEHAKEYRQDEMFWKANKIDFWHPMTGKTMKKLELEKDELGGEAKLLKGPVLNLGERPDMVGDIIMSSCVNFPTEGVPVTRGFSREIKDNLGHAMLRQNVGCTPSSVMARVELNEPTPKEVLKKLYPAIAGKLIKSHKDKDGNTVIDEMEITHLGLSTSPNVDPLISPLEIVE